MKSYFKLLAIAAAFGMAPVAASAQSTAAPAQQTGAAPIVSPAQPALVSDPATANAAAEAPANAQAPVVDIGPRATPTPGIGQPDGRYGFQDQVTPIGKEALWFHDVLLMPIITIITLFVLALMLFVIVKFRRGAHPVPSRTTHNTTLEVLWTLVPVLILVAIAVPSIKLLGHQYDPPKADITVKATGNQWYWTYSYPDNGDFEFDSHILNEPGNTKQGERPRADADGPRLLAVDERLVVPVNATVKVIVTASDVIHSWGVPAFWAKVDAVPGRLNETWFKADRLGVYYGQCFELCGQGHGYMPIAVEVVTPAQFAAWIASKGGTMPGAVKPAASDATVNSPIANMPAAASAGGSSATQPQLTPGTATPPVTSQGAQSSRGTH